MSDYRPTHTPPLALIEQTAYFLCAALAGGTTGFTKSFEFPEHIMIKMRYIAPNAFTSLNYLLGIAAILLAAGAMESFVAGKDAITLACHLVIYCVLLDKLDGFAAKIFKASSEFGAQFDSLADLVAFGLAPAFCLFFAYSNYVPEYFARNQALLMVCLALYVLCAAFRLARYNAMDADAHPDWFSGLPSTLCGGFNVAFIIIAAKYGYFTEENNMLYALPLAMASSAILMISTLYLPKLKARESRTVNLIQVIGIIAGYSFGFAMIYSELLLGLITTYAIVGLIWGLWYRNKLNNTSQAPTHNGNSSDNESFANL